MSDSRHSTHLRRQICEIARSMIGTPFVHQGRLPGIGLDCGGLLVVVGRAMGFAVHDSSNYARRPDGASFTASLAANGVERPLETMSDGDVLEMRFGSQPQHAAILDGRHIIHTLCMPGCEQVSRVERVTYDERWKKRTIRCWRWPAVVEAETQERAHG